MSAHRRRRKQSGGSDDLSGSYDELNATKETQGSEHTEDHHDSEYDTAGSESDVDSQDRAQRESGDGQEEEKPQKKLDDDEDRRNPQYIPKRGTFYEHDDRTADEPNEETVEPPVEREVKDKKVWTGKEDRWDHDRYNDAEQAPKSHAELIAVYGYDIRNEEGPPRARRRRRYGRGPNKYTRNWEDEDAYGKVSGNVPTQKSSYNRKSSRSGEEFPSLNPKEVDAPAQQDDQPVITSAWYSNKNKVPTNKNQNFPVLQQTETQKTKTKQFTNTQANENKAPNERNNTAWKKDTKTVPHIQNANTNETNVASGDAEKIVIVKQTPREISKKPALVQESVSLAASKSRGRGFKANTNNNVVGSRVIESKPKGRGPGPMPIDNRRSNIEHEPPVMNDVKHMNVSTEGPSYHHAARQSKHFYTQPSSQQHATVVPPRMQPTHPPPPVPQQAPPPQQQQQPQPPPPQQPPPQQQQQQDHATNRPKRYSSLRQRPPIAEGPPNPPPQNYQPAHTAPPPPPQHTYYPPPQGYPPPPGPYEQPPPGGPGGPSPLAGQPVIPMGPPTGQPTSYAPPPPPPFLVPPPQFLTSQQAPPGIINYVAGPNGPIFQPNYQGYNPAAVQPGPPPPQEVGLYQPQGCTYYSPAQQQQQQQQQPVPVRRPKAAIPILPPPDAPQQNPTSRPRVSRSVPHAAITPEQQQHEQQQMAQQQQQQEQLVQQQLKQLKEQLLKERQEQEKQERQERNGDVAVANLDRSLANDGKTAKKSSVDAEQVKKDSKPAIEEQPKEPEQAQKEEQVKEPQQTPQKEEQVEVPEQTPVKEEQQNEPPKLEQVIEQVQPQKEDIPKEPEQPPKEEQVIEQVQPQKEEPKESVQSQIEEQSKEPEQPQKEEQVKEPKQQKKEEPVKEPAQSQKEEQLIEPAQPQKEEQPEEVVQASKEEIKEVEQPQKEEQVKEPEQSQKEPVLEPEQQQKEEISKAPEQPQKEEQQKVAESCNNEEAAQPVVEKTTVETVSKVEPVVSNDSCTKPSLEHKLESLSIEEKSIVSIEEKIAVPIVVEVDAEKKEVATKVEVVIPEVVPSVEEKIVTPTVQSSVEAETEIPVSKCVVEDSVKAMLVEDKLSEITSEKSDADCNIKESAVIEEAAA